MSTFTQSGKSYTSVAGTRATSNVGSSAAMRDVQKAMVTYRPYQTPILAELLSNPAAKKATGNYKFEFPYSTLLPRTATVTLTGGASSEDDITVSDSALFQVGTTFIVEASGDVLTVDSIASSAVDVTLVGSGNITAAAAGSTVHFLAPSFEEGDSSSNSISVNKNFEYNYTQEMKKSVTITGRQSAMVEYGDEDWMRNKRDRMQEWKIDIEKSLLFGKTYYSSTGFTAGSYAQSWTGGLFYGSGTNSYINGADTTAIGSFDQDYFFGTFAKNIFVKGGNRKTFYVGSAVKNVISGFSRSVTRTSVGERKFGLAVNSIETDFGTLDVMWHQMLEGTTYSNWGVVVDESEPFLKYRFLSGNGVNRDFRFEEYPLYAEQEKRKGEWKADIGWQVEGDEYHYLYKGA